MLLSPLHVHAGGHHDIAVPLVGAPKVLEENYGFQVDPQNSPSADPIGLEDVAQDLAHS